MSEVLTGASRSRQLQINESAVLAAAAETERLRRKAQASSGLGELSLLDEDEALDWQERALCARTDPEAFFPEKGGSTREAKQVCLHCEVRDECLQYAIDNDERFGIWGGLSERERRKLKKRSV